MRSVFLSAVVLSLVPSMTYASFRDVDLIHPYNDAIQWMQEQGIVEGYADGTFQPNTHINRVELLKIAVSANFTEPETRLCDPHHIYDFPDAGTDEWYAPYLCLAVQHKIVEGYPDGTFRPDQPVTYVEAAKIIGMSWQHVAHLHPNNVPFPEDDGGPWYEVYVEHLENNNAVPRTVSQNGQLITRGEMAYMIYRLGVVTPVGLQWKTYSDASGRVSIDLPPDTLLNDGSPETISHILPGMHAYSGEYGTWEIGLYRTSDRLSDETWPEFVWRMFPRMERLTKVIENDYGNYIVHYMMDDDGGFQSAQVLEHGDIGLVLLFGSNSTQGGAIQQSVKFRD